MRTARYCTWTWFVMLLALNVMPIGTDMNKSLSGNDIWGFRFDYLLHSVMILGFAWLEVLKRILGFSGFGVVRFGALVLCVSVCLELVQMAIPWRSFNPVDMVYNLVGAVVGTIAVLALNRERGNPR